MIPTGTPASMPAARESSESLGLGLEVDHVFLVVSRDAPEQAALERAGLRVTIEHGDTPLLSLTFDEMGQGGTRDLRPDLPLLLRF